MYFPLNNIGKQKASILFSRVQDYFVVKMPCLSSLEKKKLILSYVGSLKIKVVSCAFVLNLVVYAFEKVMLE